MRGQQNIKKKSLQFFFQSLMPKNEQSFPKKKKLHNSFSGTGCGLYCIPNTVYRLGPWISLVWCYSIRLLFLFQPSLSLGATVTCVCLLCTADNILSHCLYQEKQLSSHFQVFSFLQPPIYEISINPLVPELFFLISAYPVYKM